MDIFEKIAFAQSMSDDTRKQNLIPMLEDLLKWHKGRGSSKIHHTEQNGGSGYHYSSAGSKLFPTASYGSHRASSELSPSDKASGIVNHLPESMVKIDKASKGIKCQKHMMAAADYISRHGKIELEDENGNLLTHDELESRILESFEDFQLLQV